MKQFLTHYLRLSVSSRGPLQEICREKNNRSVENEDALKKCNELIPDECQHIFFVLASRVLSIEIASCHQRIRTYVNSR
jgi:hypothetical protein